MRGYEKRRERIALEEKQGTINTDAAPSELTGLGLGAKVLEAKSIAGPRTMSRPTDACLWAVAS